MCFGYGGRGHEQRPVHSFQRLEKAGNHLFLKAPIDSRTYWYLDLNPLKLTLDVDDDVYVRVCTMCVFCMGFSTYVRSEDSIVESLLSFHLCGFQESNSGHQAYVTSSFNCWVILLVKCLFSKHEEVNTVPEPMFKKNWTWWCAFVFQQWGGGERQIPGGYWPASLTYLRSSTKTRDPVSK